MKSVTLITLAFMATASGMAVADSLNDRDLEPAFNGGVSSTGLYPTQAMEDRYGLEAAQGMDYDARDIEPAYNGGVSASGLFPTQEAEDRASEETRLLMYELSQKH